MTGVCLSTGGRVSASVHAGMPTPRVQADPPWTRQTPPGPGRHPPGPGRHPPRIRQTPPQTRQTPPQDQAHPPLGSRLQHMVYEWPVRILLECILVTHVCHYVHRGERVIHGWGGLHLGCLPPGGGGLRAVCILLECFLVKYKLQTQLYLE